MTHDDFLTQVINEGIAAARKDYANRPDKLNGAVAGFEACRDKNSQELKDLLEASLTAKKDARMRKATDYWWFVCYAAEVEWVCNCVSACLYNQGFPVIITPTARGMMQAAKIIGIRERVE